ncbi:DUF2789 family protein [Acinetobacter sp. ANC 4173]|jgi:hypothetical protein|uniref:DUF2789 family protein n=1 Tax=Acinetobacter sp. ANC 4173 TaxID=2529837 RepID=UPI00103CE2F9|nr:DUF2789 family protein [Acinetobacter sp. ANC 4173]TCB80907.1 DUF2789 domain-containing protein [Acinetobacter sp. ANC 4173]
MFDVQPTLILLFDQLGLDSSESAMDQFIRQHQLAADVELHQASFWTDAQREFLHSHWDKDDEWAIVIDTLNEQLHEDAGAMNISD